MLNQSTNFGMRSWLVIEKLPLIFFRFPFQRKLHGQGQTKAGRVAVKSKGR